MYAASDTIALHMDPARIAKLLEPFLQSSCLSEERSDEEPAVLSSGQLHHISTYIDILQRWNSRINLTAIRDPEEIATRHFGESLFAARCLFPKHVGIAAPGCRAGQASAKGEASRGRAALQGHEKDEKKQGALAPGDDDRPATAYPTVADVGSGAGFPGLVLKLWAPNLALTLIESNHKKATFLREVTRALTLTDVNMLNVRAETLPAQSFDLVTLRAVEHFERILPVAANLAKPSGRLALLIGADQLARGRTALPDYIWNEPILIPGSHSRVLAICKRTS